MLGSVALRTNSKQLYHLHLDGGECLLAKPAYELHEFIDYYWLLTITAPRLELAVIPDTAVDLVLSPDISGFAAMYFPVSEKFGISLQGPVHYVGVCFRSAQVEKITGSKIGELRQLQFGASTIDHLAIADLTSDIRHCTELVVLKETLDNFWLRRLSHIDQFCSRPPSLSQTELIRKLENALGNESIASVCASLQLSERQFRRLSNELFGLSPKKIQNVLRLQIALSELFSHKPQQIRDLYYDDSHRIRELKRLTGLTPQQIRHMAEKYNTG